MSCLLPLQESLVHSGGALNPESPHSQSGGGPPPAYSCNPAGHRRCLLGGLCPAAGTRAFLCCTWCLPSTERQIGQAYARWNFIHGYLCAPKGPLYKNNVSFTTNQTLSPWILGQLPSQSISIWLVWNDTTFIQAKPLTFAGISYTLTSLVFFFKAN